MHHGRKLSHKELGGEPTTHIRQFVVVCSGEGWVKVRLLWNFRMWFKRIKNKLLKENRTVWEGHIRTQLKAYTFSEIFNITWERQQRERRVWYAYKYCKFLYSQPYGYRNSEINFKTFVIDLRYPSDRLSALLVDSYGLSIV